MNKLMLLVTLAFAAATLPASAAYQMDGKMPMYPNATQDPRENVPASVIQRGAPLVLLTKDSVATVDAWYKANAPKDCKRQAASGAVQYKCAGGSIQIYNHGGTQIALVPPLGI